MKTCIHVVSISLTMLCAILCSSSVWGQQIGDSYLDSAAFTPGMTNINLGWPGRVWVQANLAEEGLGYMGSYVTLGAKAHVFQDFMDGQEG